MNTFLLGVLALWCGTVNGIHFVDHDYSDESFFFFFFFAVMEDFIFGVVAAVGVGVAAVALALLCAFG